MLAKLGVSAIVVAVVGAVTLPIATHSDHPFMVFLIGALVAGAGVFFALLLLFADNYHPQE